MNGNTHYQEASKVASPISDNGINSRQQFLAEAQVHATLALVDEQRTANLLHALEINLRAQSANLHVDPATIADRLGLNFYESDSK